jgi:radical SAM superfamily enzyme YgiQ (UPF0313 family)
LRAQFVGLSIAEQMRLYLISPLPNAHTEYSRLGAADAEGPWVTRIASAAIATVAALAPAGFDIRLCDEAVTPVDFDAEADVVGISVNVSQALRGLQIAERFRARGVKVVMGGPHVSLAPELFEGGADAIMVGELEPVADAFFSDMVRGELRRRYDGGRADMAASPAPRWDLYPNAQAMGGVVQTSRGCPFECHFCDVIQYLGRVQRHKTDAQVIGEVQALYDLGHNFISLADDNFTVYRRRARSLLAALAAWNGADGRDWVTFATQMSIDAARDPALLAMCNEAGLLNAFVGIETSDEASLAESRKRQNLHVDLVQQCRAIVSAGLRIEGGLMVGFDHDDRGCFRRQLDFAMSLPVAMFNLSVLTAPVATPLYDDLKAQGRIMSGEVIAQFPSANLVTNFQPAQMSRDELYVGARWLVSRLMHPDAVFARMAAMAEILAPPPWVRHGGRRRAHPSRRRSATLVARVMRGMSAADPATAAMIEKVRDLMRGRPEIREGLGDALSHYLMTLRGYQANGVYDADWARLPAPPFGAASAEDHMGELRLAHSA